MVQVSRRSKKSKSNFRNPKSRFGGFFKLIWHVLKLAAITFIAASLFGVLLFRFANPPFTLLMLQRGFERKAAGKD